MRSFIPVELSALSLSLSICALVIPLRSLPNCTFNRRLDRQTQTQTEKQNGKGRKAARHTTTERHVRIGRNRDSQRDKLLDTIRLNSHALDNFLH
jgi:hypothetical protein